MQKQVRADSNAKVYGAIAHPVTEGPQRKGIRWPQAAFLSSSQTNPLTSFHLHQWHVSFCALLECLPQNSSRPRMKIILPLYFRRLGQQHFPVIVILKIQKVEGFWPSSSCFPRCPGWYRAERSTGLTQRELAKVSAVHLAEVLAVRSSPGLTHPCHLKVCLRGGCVCQPAACGGSVRGGGRGEEHVLGQSEYQQDLPWIPSCPPPRERNVKSGRVKQWS